MFFLLLLFSGELNRVREKPNFVDIHHNLGSLQIQEINLILKSSHKRLGSHPTMTKANVDASDMIRDELLTCSYNFDQSESMDADLLQRWKSFEDLRRFTSLEKVVNDRYGEKKKIAAQKCQLNLSPHLTSHCFRFIFIMKE